MKIFILKSLHFVRIIKKLILSAPFLTISFIGNAIVFIFATIVFFLEKDLNPKIETFLDAIWWSFSTTTTIGYGDVVPITPAGKIVGIALMLIGVAIFAVYTALFSRAILDDDNYME